MRIQAKDPRLISLIGSFLNSYLPLVRSRDTDTIESYRYSINIYIQFLHETKNVALKTIKSRDFSQENLTEFKSWLEASRNNVATTINHRLSDIRSFSKYLMKNGAISEIEYEKIREVEDVPDKRCIEFVWLSLEDIKLILKLVMQNRNHIRDYFLISLLYESGARINEILTLKLKDIRLVDDTDIDVHFLGKGNKHRITPLSGKIRTLFDEYCAKYHRPFETDQYLFYVIHNGNKVKMSPDNVARILSECENRAKEINPNMLHLHAHLFRRSRAMHLFQAGVPLPTVSDWLGHSQIETTRIYARVTEEMKKEATKALGKSESSVFSDDIEFKYENDEEMLRRLCGLPPQKNADK